MKLTIHRKADKTPNAKEAKTEEAKAGMYILYFKYIYFQSQLFDMFTLSDCQ